MIMHQESPYKIENCTFKFKCTQDWDNLSETSEVNIKFCNKCESNVYFVTGESELKQRISQDQCVAFIDFTKLSFEPTPFKQKIKNGQKRYRELELFRVLQATGFDRKIFTADQTEIYFGEIKKIINLGKVRGYLLYEDFNKFLVNKKLEGQDLYDLISACNDVGILLYMRVPMSLGSIVISEDDLK